MTTLREVLKKNTLQTMKNLEVYSVIGTISNIRETESLCDVTPLSGTKVLDVRLSPVIGTDLGLRIIPKNATIGAVTFINNAEGYLATCNEVEKILFKISGGVEVEIIENEIYLKVGNSTLKVETDKFIFNDGSEGVSNPSQLTTKLNNLVSQILVELNKISVLLSGIGLVYPVGVVSSFVETDYTDKKILH